MKTLSEVDFETKEEVIPELTDEVEEEEIEEEEVEEEFDPEMEPGDGIGYVDYSDFVPTRFEYLFAHILSGALTGASPKNDDANIKRAYRATVIAEDLLKE
jgi:hypothetical protein